MCSLCYVFFFFKQKTAYEMRISDWSSDVCSSAATGSIGMTVATHHRTRVFTAATLLGALALAGCASMGGDSASTLPAPDATAQLRDAQGADRSEEHTSELQSLMRISYAVFCLKKKTKQTHKRH